MIKKYNCTYRKFTQSLVIAMGVSAGSAFAASYTDPEVWTNVYGSKTDIDSIDNIRGVGLVVGLDAKFDSDFILGAALSVGESEVDDSDVMAGTKTDFNTDTYQAIVYALTSLSNNTILKTTGTLGWSDNNSKRSVSGNNAKANFDAWFANVNAQIGRNYTVSDDVVMTPSLDVNFSYLSTESYDENGSPLLATHMSERSDDALSLGGKIKMQYKLLSVRLGTSYDVLSHHDSVQSRIIASGSQFTTNGAQLNEGFVFNGGIGINSPDSGALSGSLDYDFINGQDADSQTISATIKYKF